MLAFLRWSHSTLLLVLPLVLAWALLWASARVSAAEAGTEALRDRVPDYASAYVRIPGPWAALASWQGPGIRGVNADPRIAAAVEQLRYAISNELGPFEGMPAALLDLVLSQLRSPLEAIVLMAPVEGRPQPTLVLSGELSFNSTADVNTYLRRIVADQAGVEVAVALGTGRPGLLHFNNGAALLSFDTNTRRLTAVAAPRLDPQQADALLRLPRRTATPVAALEREVDTTGQGLFIWLNGRTALPYLQLMTPPDQLLKLQQWGLLDARAVALGIGSADGKGRARIAVDIPRNGLLRLIPVTRTRAALDAVGEVSFVAALNGIEADIPQRIETALAELGEQGGLAEFRKFREQVQAERGIDVISEVFASLGPEVIYFSDDAGDFAAVGLRDGQRFQALVKQLSVSPTARYQAHDQRGLRVHHLVYEPPVPASAEAASGPAAEVAAERWLARGNKVHLYWIEEGAYLLFASVPQALFDRHQASNRTSLADWLAVNSGPQYQHSAALVSLRLNHVPRTTYYYMLQGMQLLADLSNAPLDLFALPSAGELGLPDDGAVSWHLELAEQRIAIEATFDGTPLDLLAAPGAMATVAVLGVMSAVAIPAYQDYTARSATQVAYDAVTKSYNAQRRLNGGKRPRAGTRLELTPQASSYVQSRAITEGGDVLIVFAKPARLAGQTLRLRPVEGAGFTCVGDEVARKFYPRACR